MGRGGYFLDVERAEISRFVNEAEGRKIARMAGTRAKKPLQRASTMQPRLRPP